MSDDIKALMKSRQQYAQLCIDDAVACLRLAKVEKNPAHARAIIDDTMATLKLAETAISDYFNYKGRKV